MRPKNAIDAKLHAQLQCSGVSFNNSPYLIIC